MELYATMEMAILRFTNAVRSVVMSMADGTVGEGPSNSEKGSKKQFDERFVKNTVSTHRILPCAVRITSFATITELQRIG